MQGFIVVLWNFNITFIKFNFKNKFEKFFPCKYCLQSTALGVMEKKLLRNFKETLENTLGAVRF